MIELYVPKDRLHDYFYERFMAQRTQKSNNLDQLVIEVSFPFPMALHMLLLLDFLQIEPVAPVLILKSTILMISHQQCQ